MIDTASQRAIEDLLARYVHAIDDDRLEEWPNFFTEHGRYRITTAENHQAGLPLCIVQADSQAMMRDRIAALRHANIYEAQGYRHTLSAMLTKALSPNVFEAISNFIVVRIMHDGASMLFATGRYVDRIVIGDVARFEERLVVLDSRRVDTLLAIPL